MLATLWSIALEILRFDKGCYKPVNKNAWVGGGWGRGGRGGGDSVSTRAVTCIPKVESTRYPRG